MNSPALASLLYAVTVCILNAITSSMTKASVRFANRDQSNAPSVLAQFDAWFSKRSQSTINQNGGLTYPEWLNRLTRVSPLMKMKKLIRDGDQMAEQGNLAVSAVGRFWKSHWLCSQAAG